MEVGAAGEGCGAVVPNPGLGGSVPPPFLSKTYDMVDDPSTDAIVSWGGGNNSFVVWDQPGFARDLIPKYFKHSNFSSFVRQLNTYGFRKVDPDRWEFANEGFLRGKKHLLNSINRRKPAHVHSQPQAQNASAAAACVEVGEFGLGEEVERLKRDKNVLMQELVRLRQQQQATEHQLQSLGRHLHGMEQRHQQMMSFLAKAMRNPGFLAQLVQENDSNRLLAGGNKKRRLPNQEGDLDDSKIVKYEPLTNEAAKAMLMQILKMDTSPRLSNSDGLLLDNLPSPLPEAFESSSPSRNSGVTLAEAPPSTRILCTPARPGPSATCSSSAVSEIQSSVELPAVSHSTLVPGFPQMREIAAGDANVCSPSENYVGLKAEGAYIDPVSAGTDGTVPVETEKSSSDTDIELSFDEAPELPDIFDPFWEQCLMLSPVSDDTVEADSSIQGDNKMHREENPWNMGHRTEQMRLLASDTRD